MVIIRIATWDWDHPSFGIVYYAYYFYVWGSMLFLSFWLSAPRYFKHNLEARRLPNGEPYTDACWTSYGIIFFLGYHGYLVFHACNINLRRKCPL
jgi:hypothetical protein